MPGCHLVYVADVCADGGDEALAVVVRFLVA